MSDLRAYGITVSVPSGWDARISKRQDPGVSPADGGPGAELPVAHLANFALPERRGDFGSGAVESMGTGHVLICLIEFGSEEVGSALYARTGIPQFRARDFSQSSMQRTIAGMCGAQAFFSESGRAFCAYAVLGSYRSRASLAPVLNRGLAGVTIDPPSARS